MGYYSNFKLETENTDLISEFRSICDHAEYAITDNGETRQQTKWYDAIDDLGKFSTLHPNDMFILSVEGEDSGDLWKAYAKNGVVQKAKAVITYPSIDETLFI